MARLRIVPAVYVAHRAQRPRGQLRFHLNWRRSRHFHRRDLWIDGWRNHRGFEVVLFTVPSAVDPFDPNLVATTWSFQEANTFTEIGGEITTYSFEASDDTGKYGIAFAGETCCHLTEIAEIYSPANFLGDTYGPVIFTAVPTSPGQGPTSAPEPPLLAVLSTMLLAVALLARKQIANGI